MVTNSPQNRLPPQSIGARARSTEGDPETSNSCNAPAICQRYGRLLDLASTEAMGRILYLEGEMFALRAEFAALRQLIAAGAQSRV